MAKIMTCKYSWPFKNAVTEEEAPDYYSIIKSPVDLSLVQAKVNDLGYKSRQAFMDDLEQIVADCFTYNGEDTCKCLFCFIFMSLNLKKSVNNLLKWFT